MINGKWLIVVGKLNSLLTTYQAIVRVICKDIHPAFPHQKRTQRPTVKAAYYDQYLFLVRWQPLVAVVINMQKRKSVEVV